MELLVDLDLTNFVFNYYRLNNALFIKHGYVLYTSVRVRVDVLCYNNGRIRRLNLISEAIRSGLFFVQEGGGRYS